MDVAFINCLSVSIKDNNNRRICVCFWFVSFRAEQCCIASWIIHGFIANLKVWRYRSIAAHVPHLNLSFTIFFFFVILCSGAVAKDWRLYLLLLLLSFLFYYTLGVAHLFASSTVWLGYIHQGNGVMEGHCAWVEKTPSTASQFRANREMDSISQLIASYQPTTARAAAAAPAAAAADLYGCQFVMKQLSPDVACCCCRRALPRGSFVFAGVNDLKNIYK